MWKVIAVISILVVIIIIQLWPEKDAKWQEYSGFRWTKLKSFKSNKPAFSQLPPSTTNISFTNSLTPEQIKNNRVLLNGSGVAVGDIDSDGMVDIYFCRLNGSNELYKNLGNWKFKEIAAEAGVSCPDQFSTGATFADIDGDGDLDLLVTSTGGPNAYFVNDGTGKFTDATKSAGLHSNTGASTIAFADIDGDGDLDLYITNYKKIRAEDIFTPYELEFDNVVQKIDNKFEIVEDYKDHYILAERGKYVLRLETGEPDFLFINDGYGHFNKAAFTDRFRSESGQPISDQNDWGLTVRFQDIDDDGDPDIYVCNDFDSPDRLWINDGNGYFQEISKLSIRSTSISTMGIDFSDIDRDGDLDFFLVDMLSQLHHKRKTQMGTMVPTPLAIGDIDNRPQYMRNTLFLNRGDGSYAEIGQFSSVQASDWSWSPIFLDIDLDGYEDILIPTGHFYDALDSDTNDKIRKRIALRFPNYQRFIFLYPSLKLPNVVFRNRGDLTFEDVSEKWGFASEDISHGIALGDFDNDGDMDVVTNRFEFPAGVYRNNASEPRVAVRLHGLPPNTQAVGAKIKVYNGPVPQRKEVISGGTYLSGSDPLYVFATGNTKKELSIEVTWRNGKQFEITDVMPNRIYEIYEKNTAEEIPNSKQKIAITPFYKDVSDLINHRHNEDPFDDFQRQSLLPYKLSQLGPGISWFDIDNDGNDDLIIPSGKGGHLAYFHNVGDGNFERINDPLLTSKIQHDQTSVLGWTKENGGTSLLVVHSNYENQQPGESFAIRYDFKNGNAKSTKKIPSGLSSSGPAVMADYDGDGDLDLFIGGRTIPGRYPEPASSRMYLNQNEEFIIDEENTSRLKQIGMVSGAVFSDIDEDGDPDLVLAVEWGPITVYRNTDGLYSNATEELGLAQYRGWWNGVTTGDLNEDGKLDIIATNWGLNTKYHYDGEHPLKIYYNDFDNNGTLDIVEAYFDPLMNDFVPERGMAALSTGVPNIRLRTPSYKKFGEANLKMILGPRIENASILESNKLSHMIFFSEGNRFKGIELPPEAQFAPAFHVSVADFDGDGHEDVFLSQNFFSSQIETARNDAGRSLWLRGDGTGNLVPVAGQESGIIVYGEQRGAAFGDYDKDGRIDIAISQNGAQTKLYHNIGAKPGLRIQLVDSNGNIGGIGATIRIKYTNHYGPAREIHAGSGYWSQDSMIQVLGLQEEVKGIWVRWPGGKITETKILNIVNEITLNPEGRIIDSR